MTTVGQYDAIVVGAGVGGLCAAIGLGSHGLRVLVLEALERIGGKAGIGVVEGVEFDTGPSVLTLPEVFDRVFAEAGLDFRAEVRLLRPEPGFRYHFPSGAVLDLYHDVERTLHSVRDTFGSVARDEFARYLEQAKTIWQAAAPHFVWSEPPDLSGMLFGGFGRWRAISQIDPLRTLQAAIERTVATPELRMLFERYATYNGSDVRRAPATLGCIAHVELALGGYGVEGGMYQLVSALGRAAEHVGVAIRTNAPVERLMLKSGAVCGVRAADGHEFFASHVVVNADLGHLTATLLPRERARKLEPVGELSMSAYNAVYKARRRTGSERVAHEVLFPSNYLAEFADVFDHHRPPESPTVYLCAQERCHGRKGWTEHEPLFVMANAPAVVPGSTDDHATQLRQRVEERMRARGLLDAGDTPVFQRSPADWARQFPGSQGALYGSASNSALAAFKRAPNAVTKIQGLYLASGSAHPGAGLPMVAQSGQLAARAILRQLSPEAVPATSPICPLSTRPEPLFNEIEAS